MKEEVIQFVGLNELSESDKAVVNRLSTEYHERVKRKLKNMTSLTVHIKCYKTAGKRQKYSLHLKCIIPGRIFESDKKAHGWQLEPVMKKGFESLLSQIEHALHLSSSWKKSYE